jgi:hypothetical protein
MKPLPCQPATELRNIRDYIQSIAQGLHNPNSHQLFNLYSRLDDIAEAVDDMHQALHAPLRFMGSIEGGGDDPKIISFTAFRHRATTSAHAELVEARTQEGEARCAEFQGHNA